MSLSQESDPAISILDGGLGTTLEDCHGTKFSASQTPAWSSHLLLSKKGVDTLRECLTNFRKAGADFIGTPTYQAAVETFRQTPLPIMGVEASREEQRAAVDDPILTRTEIVGAVRSAVRVSTDAWQTVHTTNGKGGTVFSLGPYGACISPSQEYTGKYGAEHDSEDALYAWHLARLRFFSEAISPGAAGEHIPEAEVDLLSQVRYIAFETIPRVDEIRAVRRAMAESGLSAKIPFWVSCVFPNNGDDKYNLPDGTHISKVVQSMLSPLPLPTGEPDSQNEDKPAPVPAAVPFGIGINCTKLPKLPDLVHEFEMGVHESLLDGIIGRSPTLVLYPDGTKGETYNSATMKWEKSGESSTPEKDAEVSFYCTISTPGLNTGTNFEQLPWEEQLSKIVHDLRLHGLFKKFFIGGCCKAGPTEIKQLGDCLKADKA